MLKKTIKYKSDFDDTEVEETLYFNLRKDELIMLEASHKGGLQAALQRMIDSDDRDAITKELERLVMLTYGERDGSQHVKSQEIRDKFRSSKAFSEFFWQLCTDTDFQIQFIQGILPAGLVEEVAKMVPDQKPDGPEGRNVFEQAPEQDSPPPEPRKLTLAEIIEMDAEELKSGLAAGRFVMP